VICIASRSNPPVAAGHLSDRVGQCPAYSTNRGDSGNSIHDDVGPIAYHQKRNPGHSDRTVKVGFVVEGDLGKRSIEGLEPTTHKVTAPASHIREEEHPPLDSIQSQWGLPYSPPLPIPPQPGAAQDDPDCNDDDDYPKQVFTRLGLGDLQKMPFPRVPAMTTLR
jgi:hypothetical protein